MLLIESSLECITSSGNKYFYDSVPLEVHSSFLYRRVGAVMTNPPCIYVALAVSCITFLGVVLADSDLESKRNSSIIKMPLLHSDQVIARRRRERKLVSGESENTPTDEDEEASAEYNPSGQLFQGLGTHYVDLW